MDRSTNPLEDTARRRVMGWRDALGMTQGTLGEVIDRNAAWVSRWENGHLSADVDTLAKIAAALDHTLFELFDVKQNKREREILDCYRRIRAQKRRLAMDVLRELAGGLRRL